MLTYLGSKTTNLQFAVATITTSSGRTLQGRFWLSASLALPATDVPSSTIAIHSTRWDTNADVATEVVNLPSTRYPAITHPTTILANSITLTPNIPITRVDRYRRHRHTIQLRRA